MLLAEMLLAEMPWIEIPVAEMPLKPKAFRTHNDFESWLTKNHATVSELRMRLFKVSALHRGIGYRIALDLALCWGWIDGVRHAHDEHSFLQRFTPRKPKSFWSNVNIKRFRELNADGRVQQPGHAAFAKWNRQTAPYSFQHAPKTLPAGYLKQFRAYKAAWAWFQSQAPWYQRICAHYVLSAKRPETRHKRFAEVLERAKLGKRIKQVETGKK